MSLFEYFKNDETSPSAQMAKERLKIVVAHQRNGGNELADKLPLIKDDIIAIVSKYAKISQQNVIVKLDETTDNMSVLDIDIVIPESN
ncbi:cell division topological specificity factor MinE [Shewanella marina]|uniref:cell division topological specificity factor MinE n=1 Tax=Shewanella marina TaxID=487319 RepID=UPI00046EC3CF|nr:cell division topological specificity factor MinE [Shewanella marina]